MQDSGTIPRQIDELSRFETCSLEARDARAELSANPARIIEGCQNKSAKGQSANVDARTRMLLEQPIAPTILRLAIPNAAVMTIQILIGLMEVHFVSRMGVDALARVTPVFPLVSLVLAIAQGAIGGGFVTSVARTLGTGRIGAASECAWYAVALAIPLGFVTTAAMHLLGPSLYGHIGLSGPALAIALSYSSVIFAGATLIWLFNLLMAVVRGTGNLQVPVIVVGSGALILVPLSPVLIFGAFGYQGLGPSAAPWRCLSITLWERLATRPISGASSASSSRHSICQSFPLGRHLRFFVSADCQPSSRPARI
jgi:hypothetical protein